MRRICRLAGSTTLDYFPLFLNLSETCWEKDEKGVLVQRHNASVHLELPQTALKLTAKSLDYAQIGTLPELCITNL